MRQVIVFEDHFKKFRQTIGRDELKKLYQVLSLIMVVERVPKKFLKAIEGKNGLYETRSEYGGEVYRVFCCFDEGNLVVLFSMAFKKRLKRHHKNS